MFPFPVALILKLTDIKQYQMKCNMSRQKIKLEKYLLFLSTKVEIHASGAIKCQ